MSDEVLLTEASAPDKRILLVDGHALLYRAYHAFPPLTTPDHQPVNAVYGFIRILLKLLKEAEPEYCVVTFDHKAPTFRHESYDAYKAQRPEMPDDLKSQVIIVKEVVTALNIPTFEMAGYEADDILGTLARLIPATHPDLLTVILTGDRDSFQLVTDRVQVWMPTRGKREVEMTVFTPDAVTAKMGVRPDQIIDLKSLMGDTSDNIPGVKGVGEKTAVRLLTAFGTLDGVYRAIEAPDILLPDWCKKSLVEKLQTHKSEAYLSHDLATINTEVPIEFDLQACQVQSYDKTKAYELFQSLGFNSLLPWLPADEFELGVQSALF